MNKHQRKHLLENYFNNKSMMGNVPNGNFPGMQHPMMAARGGAGMNPAMMMGRGRGGQMMNPMMAGMKHPGMGAPQHQQQMMFMQQQQGQQNAMMQHQQRMMQQPQQHMMPGQQAQGGYQQRGNAGNRGDRGGPNNKQQGMMYTSKARNVAGQGQQGAEMQAQGGQPGTMPNLNTPQPSQQQGGSSNNLNFNREFYNSLDVKEKKQYLGEII